MDRFGLIGSGIAHSESPALFRKACSGRWEYDLLDFDDFSSAWDAFANGPYKAVNVTAPFKTQAAAAADIRAAEVERIGAANILVKTPGGILARNSDYLGLCALLREHGGLRDAAVIGLGGAGRAALAAAQDCGLSVRCFHHDEIGGGVKADLIIYTLPRFVPGADLLDCKVLLEANYKDPCLSSRPGYVGGRQWLLAQARTGFPLMTGLWTDATES